MSESNEKRLAYQGPKREYVPPRDTIFKPSQPRESEITTGGYHDMAYLMDQLAKIDKSTTRAYKTADGQLSKYSLKINTSDAELVKAHKIVYPNDKTPDYITFDEYKYLLSVSETVATKYVKSYYESSLRGPLGSTALDYAIMARTINAEVRRIKAFVETYIGALDETAEFRTVELLQDWTETALSISAQLEKGLQVPNVQEIPRAELDKLNPELSAGYQALFQTKLNTNNDYVVTALNNLEKNWNTPSEVFYNKVLGPALLFQIKFANQLTDPNVIRSYDFPTLNAEVQGTVTGLAVNYTTALADQLRRNEIFSIYCRDALANLNKRDTYRHYFKQLATKGVKLPNPFVNSSTVDQATDVKQSPNPLSQITNPTKDSTGTSPSHQDLADRENPLAHPQYLLKKGGTITGDINVADGVKIDGMELSTHKHTGQDGSAQISGSDILPGSITPSNIQPGSSTAVPENLSVFGQAATIVPPGLTKVTVEVAFEVDSTANIVGYEFQVEKIADL